MINKKPLLLIGLLSIIIISVAVVLVFNKKEIKKFHYHAGFAVYKDDKKIDFMDFKYMVVKPCSLDKRERKESDEDNQIEKAHLHDMTGDVVHVERENSKWSDLFKNLKYNIDYGSITAYINGKKVDNIQNLVIHPYDSLVVLIGKNNAEKPLSNAVTIKHIKEAEKRSENCG